MTGRGVKRVFVPVEEPVVREVIDLVSDDDEDDIEEKNTSPPYSETIAEYTVMNVVAESPTQAPKYMATRGNCSNCKWIVFDGCGGYCEDCGRVHDAAPTPPDSPFEFE